MRGPERPGFECTRFLRLENPWNLTPPERRRLSEEKIDGVKRLASARTW